MSVPIGAVVGGLGPVAREAMGRAHGPVEPVDVRERPEDAQVRLAAQRAAREAWWTQNVPARFRAASLDSLTAQQHPAAVTGWYRATSPLNLLVWGDSRRGKSWLGYALGNQAVADGLTAVGWTVADLMVALRTDGRAEQAWDRLERADVVVLDDLGREYDGTGWARSQVHRLLDYRIRENRRTVTTTNLAYDALLDRYGDPIVSRLVDEATVLHVTGDALTG